MTIRVVPNKRVCSAPTCYRSLRNRTGIELLQKAFGGHRRWVSIYPFLKGIDKWENDKINHTSAGSTPLRGRTVKPRRGSPAAAVSVRHSGKKDEFC
jgi:hypothetical protein